MLFLDTHDLEGRMGGWNHHMVEKIAFTKEEIESRVKVPAIVEVELKHLIEERLKQSGLYYRICSRIKTSESLARK